MRKVYKHTDCTQILTIGDIHGEFNAIRYNIVRHDLKDCVLIVLGDIGMGFNALEYYRTTFKKLTKILKERNIQIYLFRGNHDEPKYFKKSPFRFDNIHLIDDYSVIVTHEHTILCIGGATSIDRSHRVANDSKREILHKRYHSNTDDFLKSYWQDEAPVYDEEALNVIKEEGITIDTVCTHTAPSFCQPCTHDGIRSWLVIDPELETDLHNERHVMDEIHSKLLEHGHPIERWHYGHFHMHNAEIIDGIMYRALDCCRNGMFDMVEIR